MTDSSGGTSVGGRRVGLVYAGDARDLRSWSGTPAGLSAGLVAAGCEVDHVDANLNGALLSSLINGTAVLNARRFGLSRPAESLRRGRWQARAAPAVAGVRRAWVDRRLRRLPPVQAVVQVHGEYPVGSTAPVATYDDLTVVQALRLGYLEFERMPPAQVARRVASQQAAYERAAACCTTSAWAAESIVHDYGIPRERVFAVGVGTNRGAVPPPDRDWSVPRFLFVGKDWQRKNGTAVVAAFGRVRTAVPAAELDLVGDIPRVDAPGVRVHGPLQLADPAERAAVDDLYRRATCFVMPSHVEPSAVAYVEAAGFGLPVIATTVGGSGDIVGDGGVLVDPHDDEALTAAMLGLCDGADASALGARAAVRAALFSWPAVASRILAAVALPGFEAAESALDTWAGR